MNTRAHECFDSCEVYENAAWDDYFRGNYKKSFENMKYALDKYREGIREFADGINHECEGENE